MRIPDLEADIEYEEDLQTLLDSTLSVENPDKLVAFWRSYGPETVHASVMHLRREQEARQTMWEAQRKGERRKETERELIIKLGLGR